MDEPFLPLLRLVEEDFNGHVELLDEFVGPDIVEHSTTPAMGWRFTRTHQGEFMGVAPTGRPIETTGVNIERVEDGKIGEQWTFSDPLAVWDQLGVQVPASARP
jgi:predicted ester cyclase